MPKEFAVTGTVYNSFISNQYSLTGSSSLFDGSTSTVAQDWNGVYNSTANPPYRVEFTPPTPISYSSQVEIYSTAGPQSPYSNKVYIDTGSGYGSGVSVVQNGWVTAVSGSGSFTKLKVEGLQNGTNIAAIRVDGTILTDGNGYGRNGFHLNFSDSSTIEALGFDSAPTIPDLDPKKGMDVITYSGTYARLNVGGLNFEPGLVWIKNRDSGSSAHFLADSVRGGTKVVQSNSTGAENTRSNHILSFNPDGFTLGADGTSNYPSGNSFVAWTWRAGGPAVANTDGTLTAQVSANTDYGFSIIKWTGVNNASPQTVGHGLTSQTPKFFIVKNLDTAQNWAVYHASLGNTKYLTLNSSSAAGTSSAYWNDTSPTSTLIHLNNNDSVQRLNNDFVLYAWSEVSGFSKFGSYSGSGSANKTVTGLGFKPRFVIIKRTDALENWQMVDSKRGPDRPLFPDLTDAEQNASGGTREISFQDDGFTLVGTHAGINASGGSYVYAAFADRPGNNWDVNNIVTNEGLSTSKSQFDIVTYTGNGATQTIGTYKPSENATVVGGTVSDPGNAFNGSSANWATLTATNTSTAAHVDFAVNLTGITRIEAAYDLSNHGSGDTRGRYNGANAGIRIQSGSGYRDIYNGSAITVTSVGFGINQNSTTGTSYDVVSRFRITDSQGTRFILDDTGPGLKFQPDLVWIKSRSQTSFHVLCDSVRGAGVVLSSNRTTGDTNNADSQNAFKSFNSNGFTVGQGSAWSVNDSNQTHVAWCWKAGSTAVSNTDGSITSSVSANAAYGFSVVTWTGTATAGTIGHGLNGKVPKFIITKRRDSSGDWYSQHASLGATYRVQLNSSAAATSGTSLWNSTSPTGSVFSVGADNEVNASGGTFVAYCFADVPGYQRIGTYYTNSSDPTVITGFKPRFLLVKKHNGAGNWMLLDSQRSTDDNDIRTTFEINNSNGEETHANRQVKFLDNGFQLIGADMDTSNSNWLYWAIGDDEIGSDEDCLVDVPNAVTADAGVTDTTGGYQRGNYATMNPLHNPTGSSFSNGNLQVSNSGGWYSHTGTIGVASGKWYYEFEKTSGSYTGVGWRNDITTAGNPSFNANGGGIYLSHNGNKQSSAGSVSYGATWGSGDIVGVAFDCDAGTIEFYKNGVSQGQAFTGMTDGTFFPEVQIYQSGGVINFGQMRFKYPMPSGYAALNTTALPAATIQDGSAYFDVKTYTGNGSTQSITGLEFSPDWVWIKTRSNAQNHGLFDTVRGAGRSLRSSTTGTEQGPNTSTDGDLRSFTSDGFTLGSCTASGAAAVNVSGQTQVAWCWDAGSSTVSNTDGSITSNVRANPTAGFSIVTYTGTGSAGTVGHGLNAVPEMIILKGRNFADNWRVYHKDLDATEPEDYYLMLESLNQRSADQNASFMNDTAPTNSVFSLGTDSAINGSSQSMLAYCFTSVSGYSQLGSFEGNGNANGPFVYLGFRPAFLLVRLIEGANSSWKLYDSSRDPDNPIVRQLYANSNNAEPSDDVRCDFLSNGFKVRTAGSEDNYNNNTLIYYAVAENPFQANGGLAR